MRDKIKERKWEGRDEKKKDKIEKRRWRCGVSEHYILK